MTWPDRPPCRKAISTIRRTAERVKLCPEVTPSQDSPEEVSCRRPSLDFFKSSDFKVLNEGIYTIYTLVFKRWFTILYCILWRYLDLMIPHCQWLFWLFFMCHTSCHTVIFASINVNCFVFYFCVTDIMLINEDLSRRRRLKNNGNTTR